MSAIDDLIAQIEDRALRERLREETSRITKEKKFGLVFEEHLPERTPLYNAKIVVGSRVAKRGGDLSKVWVVLSLSGEQALCIEQKTGKENNFSIDEIMVVADFEEPIFPALRSMDKAQTEGQEPCQTEEP